MIHVLVIHQYLSVTIHRSLALSGSVNSFSSRRSCDEVGDHLNNRQVQVCKRYIDVMNSVKFGATIAVQECQHQFRYRRWNCTTVQFEKSPVFGNSANGGEKHFKLLSFRPVLEVQVLLTDRLFCQRQGDMKMLPVFYDLFPVSRIPHPHPPFKKPDLVRSRLWKT